LRTKQTVRHSRMSPFASGPFVKMGKTMPVELLAEAKETSLRRRGDTVPPRNPGEPVGQARHGSKGPTIHLHAVSRL